MSALREYLTTLPPGTLQVGPYMKPLTVAQAFELDAAVEAWDEAGYYTQTLDEEYETVAIAFVVDRMAHLMEPGGAKKVIAIAVGDALRDFYTIDGVRWTVHRVDRVARPAQLEEAIS